MTDLDRWAEETLEEAMRACTAPHAREALEGTRVESVTPSFRGWRASFSNMWQGVLEEDSHLAGDLPSKIVQSVLTADLATTPPLRGRLWKTAVREYLVPLKPIPRDAPRMLLLAAAGRSPLPRFALDHLARTAADVSALVGALGKDEEARLRAAADAERCREVLPGQLRRALSLLPAEEVQSMLDAAVVESVLKG